MLLKKRLLVPRRYAFWVTKRDPTSDVCVLCIEIPNVAIEGLDDDEMLNVYQPLTSGSK